jgi:hypothetical protein
MRIILCCVAARLVAEAAAISSAQSGNWNNPSTWVGGVIPGDGDTVTIGNGTHQITVPAGVTVTVGDNTATPAIHLSASGTTFGLIVAGTLRVRGDIQQANRPVQLQAGAIVRASSTTRSPRWISATAALQSSSYVQSDGTSGSVVTIDRESGALNWAGLTSATELASSGSWRATYTDFRNIGGANDDTGAIFQLRANSADFQLVLTFCRFESAGAINVTRIENGAAIIRIEDSSFRSPLSSNGRWAWVNRLAGTVAAITTGTRSNQRNDAEGVLRLTATAVGTQSGFTVGDNVFDSGASLFTNAPIDFGSGTGVAAWSGNLVYNRQTGAGSSIAPTGSLTDTIALRRWDTTTADIDFFRWLNLGASVTIDGWYFETDTTANDSDVLTFDGNPAGPRTITLTNSILASTTGSGTGTMMPLVSISDLANVTVQITGNTVVASTGWNESLVRYENASGVVNTGGTGSITIRSNAAWRSLAGTYALTSKAASTPTISHASISASNNWVANNSGNAYTSGGLTAGAFSGTAGASDSAGSLGFAEPPRTFLRWCLTLSPAIATWQACIDAMTARTIRTGYDSRFQAAAALNWLRRGYAPRNVQAARAGAGNARAGAVAPILTIGAIQ